MLPEDKHNEVLRRVESIPKKGKNRRMNRPIGKCIFMGRYKRQENVFKLGNKSQKMRQTHL